jgi:hypothetical protein
MMAVEDQQQESQQEQGSDGPGKGTAVKAAAAAAATSVAALAAKKAFSHRGSDHSGNGRSSSGGDEGSVLSSVLSGGWDAARDALIPAAEDAAAAAGEYLASKGPEVVRDRIVPRFIESFNEAQSGS